MKTITTQLQANLTGKIALVTGASRGLGAYYAKVLAQNGAHVVVTGRQSSEDKLHEVVHDIQNTGGPASSLIIDMSAHESFESNVAKLIEQYKKIDILVNNAAVSSDINFFEIDASSWDRHFDANLKGLFFLSQAVAKQMKNQSGFKSIINIAAINGQRVRKNCLPFSVSKAGVIHLTRVMAYELIQYGIHVNAISLGLFASESVVDYLESAPDTNQYLNNIPQKRAGEYNDLDGPLLLLASAGSSYMTGSILNVDGGFASNVFMNKEVDHAPSV